LALKSVELMKVSIVIPVWNGATVIGGCLDSLEAHSDPALLEVIAVENASEDGSAELISSRYPRVRLLRQPVNLGFAGGVNAGLEAAQGDVSVLLNQDCVAEAGWLGELVKAMEAHPDYGLFGCTLFMPDGSVDHAGAVMSRPEALGSHLTDVNDPRVRPVEYATGAALAIRRAVWDKVGRFDEGFYPAYFEEVDYCYRARRLGFTTAYVPASRLKHLRASTAAARDPVRYVHHQQRARYRFVSKHFDVDEMKGFFAFELASIASEQWFAQAVGRVLAARETLSALSEIFARRLEDLGQETKAAHQRQVSVGFAEVMHRAFAAAERLGQPQVFETPSQMSPVFQAWQTPPGPPAETGGLLVALRVKAGEFLRTLRRGGPTSVDPAALAELNQILTAQMEDMSRIHAQRLDQLSRRLAVLELLADYERR